MQVFEFHFNPKIKENLILDSFCYEPENISEKRLGSLYMAGQLFNTLPSDSKFLSNLAKVIKEEYYSDFQRSSESALRESLRKANELLSKIAKQGEISWLGNLNFTILSIKETNLPPFSLVSNVPFETTFAQIGTMKILFLKENEVLDVSIDSEIQRTGVYPLKIFENIVTGKLNTNNKIMILTEDIFEYFKKENLIKDFTQINDKKSLNEILKPKKEELSSISGIFLFSALAKSQIKKSSKLFTFLGKIPWPSKIALGKNTRLILSLILILVIAFLIFKK